MVDLLNVTGRSPKAPPSACRSQRTRRLSLNWVSFQSQKDVTSVPRTCPSPLTAAAGRAAGFAHVAGTGALHLDAALEAHRGIVVDRHAARRDRGDRLGPSDRVDAGSGRHRLLMV